MKRLSLFASALVIVTCFCVMATAQNSTSDAAPPALHRPDIVKQGTLGLDLCETTPFVFRGKLYRLEWFRKGSYLRIMDHDTHKEVSRFGEHHRFACAYAEGDTVYVVGTKETAGWTGDILTMFTSKDLKTWDQREIFNSHGDNFCNTSLCKADGRYVMSYEENRGGFHAQFLESKDLLHWTTLPMEQTFHPGRYCAPHCLRWNDGWFYLLYLEAGKPHGYEQYIVRSHDLIHWQPSPLNPVLAASAGDKLVLNPFLTEEDRAAIAKNGDRNNSDIDFCDFNGKLIINYCWGTQGGPGHEYVAEAEYAGTTAQFLEGWFPDLSAWAGIDLTQPPSTFLKRRADYGRVISATGATVTTSSTHGQSRDHQQLLSGSCKEGFAFHTEPETNPWVTIDLGRESSVTGVLVRNRSDCCQERAENLRLQISSDGKQWREIWKASSVEPRWEISLLDQKIKTRYLRLDTRPASPSPLHLQHVEVWGMD